ncbi:MAG: RNase H-like domain-containing protein, partial [Candidatus Phytoplasma australasiaticum]|nr:RNase H-like domain-containing protein [Candidatus Phytoplasma australasiaticum]
LTKLSQQQIPLLENLVFVEFESPYFLNLGYVLKRYIETNLVLNWEKCYFIVHQGIILWHKVSGKGLEVGKAKVGVIENIPPPISVKGIHSFLGHAGFYRRFIKDFSKISKSLCSLLEKDVPFKFDDECLAAFETLKKSVISTPVITAPDWNEPFEIMCDASDYAVGAVLGQRKNNIFHVVYNDSCIFLFTLIFKSVIKI